MKAITCNHKRMREINRLQVLNLLREKGAISRTELASLTNLDAKTITNLTQDLLSSNLIVCGQFEASGCGRPRELLRLNHQWKYSLGIYLGVKELRAVLVDLKGDIVREKTWTLNEEPTLKAVLSLIKSASSKIVESILFSKLMGVGFVLPGITDPEREVILQASNLGYLEGVKIKETLKRLFKKSVEIEDSSRAMALAEKWFGRAKGIDNFVFLDLGVGIGCAIVTHGQLQYGASLSAGEIGHTIVDINGPPCICGHRGCLESLVSTRQILKKMSKISGRSISLFEGLRLAKEGNKEAVKIITEAGYYIGVGVSNLVNLLNPACIIIGGELASDGDILFKAINDAVKKYAVPASYRAVKIIPASLGEKGGALGAATLILKKIFELKELE